MYYLQFYFQLMDDLRADSERRNWMERREIDGNICDIDPDAEQVSTSVKIPSPMLHNSLTSAEEYMQ
jgi:hypothetical protein